MRTDRFAAAMSVVLCIAAACSGTTTPADTVTGDLTPVDAVTDDLTPVDAVTDDFVPPACGNTPIEWNGLIPGPGQDGFDADLEAKATRIERAHQIFVTAGLDVNKDISISLENADDRQSVTDFLTTGDSWDYQAFSGKSPLDVITTNHKVAGLYAGVGIAANAYRYGVLRNQGYPCEDVERARDFLLKSLDALHLAQEITGTPGVIARGFQRNDIPHNEVVTVPLFDGEGNPLPEGAKNNGTWRDDQSGNYPNYSWEDSVSRDMYIGWVTAQAAAWEVIRDDEWIPDAYKTRLQADALLLAKELMKVRCHDEWAPDCYDLEIPDADGRITLHGWLNPQNFDGQFYIPGGENGFHAVMALGIVAAFAYVTEDPEVTTYLDGLIGARQFPRIIAEHGWEFVDMGTKSNYSNYNMAFAGLWLCMRYLEDTDARKTVGGAIGPVFYDRPDQPRQAADIGYSYYDFIYAAGDADFSAWAPGTGQVDETAVARGIGTLKDYHDAPYWDFGVTLCPDAVCTEDEPAVDSPDCDPADDVHFTVLGCVGRNGDLITEQPVPMSLLGPSNYHWRSNPYVPNRNGEGSALLPSVDFRIAYWMGRWARR